MAGSRVVPTTALRPVGANADTRKLRHWVDEDDETDLEEEFGGGGGMERMMRRMTEQFDRSLQARREAEAARVREHVLRVLRGARAWRGARWTCTSTCAT